MTTDTCGCCAGTEPLTPLPTANRPGLDELAFRAGTHATFFETMKARLSGMTIEVESDSREDDTDCKVQRNGVIHPLRELTTRSTDDPAIAFLDGWATVADVLTFYQERIANEGYLRTATERRSVLELARLVGYALRPGVSASVYLALTLDAGAKVVIEANQLRVQSVPGPGELPQTFENSDTLDARAAWNVLKPRLSQPQTEQSIMGQGCDDTRLYLQSISTNLRENDPLLIDFGNDKPIPFRVKTVQTDVLASRTRVNLRCWHPPVPVELSHALAEQLRAWASRHLNETAEELGVIGSEIHQFVEDAIGALERELQVDQSAQCVIIYLRYEMLPALRKQLDSGVLVGSSESLWLSGLAEELEVIVITAMEERAEAMALFFTLPDVAMTQTPVNTNFDPVLQTLVKPRSIPPRNALQLPRSLNASFAPNADAGLQTLLAFQPDLATTLPVAVANTRVTQDSILSAYVPRLKTGVYGNNAPLKPILGENGQITGYEEWLLQDRRTLNPKNVIALDAQYDQITPGSWIVIQRSNREFIDEGTAIREQCPLVRRVVDVATVAHTDFNFPVRVTELTLDADWLDDKDRLLSDIRGTVVYAQSEAVALAEEVIASAICGDEEIELDGLYSDLQAGRWLIIAGERTDIEDANQKVVTGIIDAELVMLNDVVHRVAEASATQSTQSYSNAFYGSGSNGYYTSSTLPGDKKHTFIKLAQKLAYCYKRDSVTIYGNVVKATNGETRMETLGSGDASIPFQSFTLRQPPLTYVAAPTAAGAESTLKLYVNDVQWQEIDSFVGLTRNDRAFVTRTDNEGRTAVIFGNGREGARPPTGVENIEAIYRNGIGKSGNVQAEQISLLMTRPLGVRSVINPLRASGGADRESRDSARRNAPLAVTALDRLVSVQDYADFARTFAGIGKAAAQQLSDGQREIVFVTVAGAEDVPIDANSDLYQNLLRALRQSGDPYQPLFLEVRELLLMVVSARIQILPAYLWEPVVTNVRARLYDTFSFERRELGQDVLLSEVISAIQGVPGVAYVDVDILDAIPEKKEDAGTRRLLTPEEIINEVQAMIVATTSPCTPLPGTKPQPQQWIPVNMAGREGASIRPAQIAFLSPDVPDTLVLTQIL